MFPGEETNCLTGDSLGSKAAACLCTRSGVAPPCLQLQSLNNRSLTLE